VCADGIALYYILVIPFRVINSRVKNYDWLSEGDFPRAKQGNLIVSILQE